MLFTLTTYRLNLRFFKYCMALVNPEATAEATTVLSKHFSVFICMCSVQGQVTSSRTEANYNPYFKDKFHTQGREKITTLSSRASTKLKYMSESQPLV